MLLILSDTQGREVLHDPVTVDGLASGAYFPNEFEIDIMPPRLALRIPWLRCSSFNHSPVLRSLSRPALSYNRTTICLSTAALKRLQSTTPSTPKTVVSPTQTTWVDCLPVKTRPYFYLTRIDKPIGTLLLFYPCGTEDLPLSTSP